MTNLSIPIINQYVALIKLDPEASFWGRVEGAAKDLITSLNLNVVKKTGYSFHPEGVTLAYILSESHLLIHTWPESGLIHIDLVTCSYRSKEEFRESLEKAFSGYNVASIKIKEVVFD
ncbi:MAG: S-adenosylmethionine decarboxylase proenzyme [Microgenomates bacterium 39_6]|nr:MAG: S-adenosylmethionine decarboxylase proenzyme [Microgenomates bacterium 39_6]